MYLRYLFMGICFAVLSLSFTNVYAFQFDEAHYFMLHSKAPTLKPVALRQALSAYNKAKRDHVSDSDILTVVDYTKPGSQPRLWVFNVAQNKLLFKTLVAHGNGSGNGDYATTFSDKAHTHASSLGLYKTENAYYGGKGYALRLKGLYQGLNSHAYQRTVVVHGAWYVSPAFAKAHKRLGHSWGCFALDKKISTKVINTIKNGSLIYAYYPSPMLKAFAV